MDSNTIEIGIGNTEKDIELDLVDNYLFVSGCDLMKCTYCFKRTGSILYKDRYFCTEECRLKTVKYQEGLERNTKRYLTGVFVPLLLLIPGFVFIDYMFVFMFLMLFIMGTVLIVYPFTTTQTIDMMGVKKSMRFARLCGYGMILMGIMFSVVLYWLTWIR